MKKLLVTAAVAALLSTAGIAQANHTDEGGVGDQGQDPHKTQDHGLCTAYFNGNKYGHDKNDGQAPPPFFDLENRGQPDDNDSDDDGATDSIERNVYEYCGTLIGGNPWVSSRDGTRNSIGCC